MTLTKLRPAAAVLLALAGAAIADGQPPRGRGERPAVGEKAALVGPVVAVEKDGKTFTVEVPSMERGGPPEKVAVSTDEKTAITFNGVGSGGAKPTEGYTAVVHLDDAAKGRAASVEFRGPEGGRRGPDLTGRLVSVAPDGKTITVEVAARGREDAGKRHEIKLNERTVALFSLVAAGEAKPAEGYEVRVEFEDGKTDTAGVVHYVGKQPPGSRDEKRPDLTGKVVAADGKTITVEVPPTARGEEPRRVEVKLGDKTPVVFHEVGPDGTKPEAGQLARVWLADGSKDAAAKVALTGQPKERWNFVVGKVVGVAPDGRTITVEVPSARPREEEPRRVEVRLTAATRQAFFGVGPDGAKATEGYVAQVRFAEGSKDTAFQVLFTKPGPGRGR